MPVLTLASIAADLEAVETAALGRGSLACDHLATRLTTIRGDLQRIAALSAPAEAQAQVGGEVVAWQHPDTLPPVKAGQYGWFWVAVRRANGRIYSFPATYLNAMVLTDENCDQEENQGNRYHHGPVDEDEGTFEATGWHDAREHYEYSAVYLPLLDSDKDELIAWRSVADYGDTAPPSAPVGVEGLIDALEKLRRLALVIREHGTCAPLALDHIGDDLERALAQQPAAVDEAIATASDRDLLKMVAAAVGLKWRKDIEEERAAVNIFGLWITNQDGSLGNTAWNPLHSSSDAFHLAVELGISVCVRGDAAATRRAIVHAALAAQQGGATDA